MNPDIHGEFGDDSSTAPYMSGWEAGLEKLTAYVADSQPLTPVKTNLEA